MIMFVPKTNVIMVHALMFQFFVPMKMMICVLSTIVMKKMANVKKINLTVMIRMFVLWMFVIMEDVFTQFYLLVFSLLSRIHQLQQQL